MRYVELRADDDSDDLGLDNDRAFPPSAPASVIESLFKRTQQSFPLVAVVTLLILAVGFGVLSLSPDSSPKRCDPSDGICARWGSAVLSRSRAYEGSGRQMERFLKKVRAGKHVRIGVIGGSISACVDSSEEACYVRRMEVQLRREFARFGATVDVLDGAISAVGSDFFSACWPSAFVEELDLAVLELAVNDVDTGKENRPFDELLRSLFERPSRPSVLILNMWSPLFGWSNGAPGIENLAQYYDLPVISHRAVIYHQRRLHASHEEVQPWFSQGAEGWWPGGHHPGPLGHQLTADLLVSFVREQLYWPPISIQGSGELDLPDEISAWNPFQHLDEPPHPIRAASKCYGPQPGASHFPITTSPSQKFLDHPFREAHWKNKHYLAGYEAGDRVEFDVNVTQGWAGMMYWRSASLGLGRAWVWLEGEEEKKTWLWGDWGDSSSVHNIPVRHDMHTDFPPGPRKIVVEISEESKDPGRHEFRISTLIT